MTKNFIKYKNVEYVMPILFGNSLYIPVFQELFKNYAQYNPVKYAYGSIKSVWSSGRISTLNITRLDYIDKYLEKVKKYDIIPTFTFTNPSVNQDLLNDKFCNNLLDIAYHYDSHFIVADENLYNHIKSRYKEAHMVCSVIIPSIKYNEGFFNETEFYNKMLDKYDIVVVRPEWCAENLYNINKLINDIDRIEVLINQHCQYNCPVCKTHYETISEIECSKISLSDYEKAVNNFCPKNKPGYRSVYMSEEFVDKLIEIGIRKLKLQGRNFLFMELFDDFYKFFFNENASQQEIRQEIIRICAEKIQNNNLAQLNLL